jgi:hypothetical protein
MRTKGAFLPDLKDDYFDIEPDDPKITLEEHQNQ